MAAISELINEINSLTDKEPPRTDLRLEYESVTQYTIHYSNVRVGLSTLFVTMAGLVLYEQIKENDYSCLRSVLGLFLMLFGVLVNCVVTHLMQMGIKRLADIENILSSTAGSSKTSEIKELLVFFSRWGSSISTGSEWKHVVREKLSKLYIFLAVAYLLIVAFRLGWICFCCANHPRALDPNTQIIRKLDSLKVDISRLRLGIKSYVIGQTFFGFSSDTLTEDGKQYLRNLIPSLSIEQASELLLVGHTDDIQFNGSASSSNEDLSKRRAKTVARFLVKVGIDSSLISIRGYAEQYPVAPNNTKSNRQRNRRVEIVLVTDVDLSRP